MKKVLELVLFTLFSFSALSQNFVSDNYQNFLDAENSTVVQVHGVTFQMAAEILSEAEGENAEEIREALKTIKSFQLLAMPDIDDPISEYTKGLNNLDNAFDELVNVKDNENRFSIQIDEEDGIVYEVIGLGTEGDEGNFIAFSLTGEIPLEMVGEIINKAQSKGGKNFTDLLDDKTIVIDEFKVFPNPTSANNKVTLEIPENLIGGEGLFVDLNGKVVSSFQISDQTKELDTKGLTPGYYVVSLTKDGRTIKRKVNVIR
tara:strand:- start:2349 stop:3128 length:780 start_codon:yes stop_codon:yes gene_type:complete